MAKSARTDLGRDGLIAILPKLSSSGGIIILGASSPVSEHVTTPRRVILKRASAMGRRRDGEDG